MLHLCCLVLLYVQEAMQLKTVKRVQVTFEPSEWYDLVQAYELWMTGRYARAHWTSDAAKVRIMSLLMAQRILASAQAQETGATGDDL